MAKTTAKLVLSLDAETQTYRPVGHNLSAEQAIEHANRIQTDGGTAVIVEQESQHRALSFHRCQLCKTAAEAYGKQTQPVEEQQPATAEVGNREQE